MLRSSVDILVQLLRNVRNRGHGYDHSLTLSRGCARSPLDSINPFCPWPSCGEKERRRLRRDLWEMFPGSSGQTHTREHPLRTAGIGAYNLLSQGRAIIPSGCTGSKLNLERLKSLCSWVAVHKCTYSGITMEMALSSHSTLYHQ